MGRVVRRRERLGIPSADGVSDPVRRDELEATALYELLGKSVAPLFYERDAEGIPQGWIERIRHTFRSLGPKVRAERMVKEYVSSLYVPAAVASRNLADADGGFGPARELAAWKHRVVQAWPQVRIEHVETEADGQALGSALTMRVSVALGTLTPDDVMVEVVYGRPDDADEIVSPAVRRAGGRARGGRRFRGSLRSAAAGVSAAALPRQPAFPRPALPRPGRLTAWCDIPVRYCSTSQDRSGTRCGCCRTIHCSTAAPNSAW